MRADEQRWTGTVTAAQAGDQRALDELIARYLPLVYNIVGRALDGHLDVDDVVQETMLRAVNGLDGLRDPDSFRSWLVAIAMRQVRDRARSQRGGAVAVLDAEWDRDRDRADPGADFVDLTILRLHLEGQRQEVAEATRWLDDDDRHLLSLWWLEVAGELTRRELATALELTPQHAAVRIQRLKAQLEAARSVVRALGSVPRCYELGSLALEWDGRPSPLWRKRLARHTRECPDCGGTRPDLVPADRLLVGLALVPLPVGFAVGWQLLPGTAAVASAAAAHPATAGLAQSALQLLLKPAVAVTAGVTLAAGGAVVVYQTSHGSGGSLPYATATAPAASHSAAPSADSTLGAATRSLRPSASPTPSPRSLYGSVVDTADKAPANDAVPGALPKRPESTLTSTGGSKAVMQWATNTVTLKGKGYFRVRWQLGTTRKSALVMPTWTGLKGKLFHVASGGGYRMDEQQNFTGFTLPAGAQQMWQNEYYYVDGQVTLHQNESSAADYGLTVEPRTWADITADIMAGPPDGLIRYGLVRDTGGDDAPVPQYLTRSEPEDQSEVPQRSRVTP